MARKLTYFDISGYAESIRYILHYTGKTFEDDRIDRKQWPIKEKKEGQRLITVFLMVINSVVYDEACFLKTNQFTPDLKTVRLHITGNRDSALPFGKIPVYEENGKVLHQSIAIARYVAAGTELLPSDPWEQAQLDAVVLTLYDFSTNHAFKVGYETDPVKKEEALKKLFDEDADYFFSRFEKILKDNNGYFGGKLSWADFVFVGMIEVMNMFLKTNFEKNYPAIKKLVQEIPSLPGVREYVAKRKPYVIE